LPFYLSFASDLTLGVNLLDAPELCKFSTYASSAGLPPKSPQVRWPQPLTFFHFLVVTILSAMALDRRCTRSKKKREKKIYGKQTHKTVVVREASSRHSAELLVAPICWNSFSLRAVRHNCMQYCMYVMSNW
jgi:hypothetical protein